MIIKNNLKQKTALLVCGLAAAFAFAGCAASGSTGETFALQCFGKELEASVLKTEICTDPAALADENLHLDISEQPLLNGAGDLNPALIWKNEQPVKLLMIQQSYKNTGSEEVELSLAANQLNPVAGKEVKSEDRLELLPVYLELPEGFSSRDQITGVYLVKVPAGETVQITMGYPIPESYIGQEMEYKLRPFGDTNAKNSDAAVKFIP